MQGGSEEAFTVLYQHYSPQLYLNIVRMVRDRQLAEEIVQELFTRIWQKRSSIGLAENFAGYMYRVGQHLVHDFFRKVKRDQQLMQRFRKFAEDEYLHVEEGLNYQRSLDLLGQALKELPPQQKKVY